MNEPEKNGTDMLPQVDTKATVEDVGQFLKTRAQKTNHANDHFFKKVRTSHATNYARPSSADTLRVHRVADESIWSDPETKAVWEQAIREIAQAEASVNKRIDTEYKPGRKYSASAAERAVRRVRERVFREIIQTKPRPVVERIAQNDRTFRRLLYKTEIERIKQRNPSLSDYELLQEQLTVFNHLQDAAVQAKSITPSWGVRSKREERRKLYLRFVEGHADNPVLLHQLAQEDPYLAKILAEKEKERVREVAVPVDSEMSETPPVGDPNSAVLDDETPPQDAAPNDTGLKAMELLSGRQEKPSGPGALSRTDIDTQTKKWLGGMHTYTPSSSVQPKTTDDNNLLEAKKDAWQHSQNAAARDALRYQGLNPPVPETQQAVKPQPAEVPENYDYAHGPMQEDIQRQGEEMKRSGRFAELQRRPEAIDAEAGRILEQRNAPYTGTDAQSRIRQSLIRWGKIVFLAGVLALGGDSVSHQGQHQGQEEDTSIQEPRTTLVKGQGDGATDNEQEEGSDSQINHQGEGSGGLFQQKNDAPTEGDAGGVLQGNSFSNDTQEDQSSSTGEGWIGVGGTSSKNENPSEADEEEGNSIESSNGENNNQEDTNNGEGPTTIGGPDTEKPPNPTQEDVEEEPYYTVITFEPGEDFGMKLRAVFGEDWDDVDVLLTHLLDEQNYQNLKSFYEAKTGRAFPSKEQLEQLGKQMKESGQEDTSTLWHYLDLVPSRDEVEGEKDEFHLYDKDGVALATAERMTPEERGYPFTQKDRKRFTSIGEGVTVGADIGDLDQSGENKTSVIGDTGEEQQTVGLMESTNDDGLLGGLLRRFRIRK